MKAKTNGITVTPVKKYAAPKYPTQTAAEREPELLRKLPPRWEQNVRVAAAVTMIGAMTLTGCGIKKTDNSSAVVPATEVEITADVGQLAGDVIMDLTTEQDMTMDTGELAGAVIYDLTIEQDTGDLAGEILVDLPTEQNFTTIETTENDIASFLNVAPVFFHGGGTGSMGCIMVVPPVFLSEQEALAIIKNAAEGSGLHFSTKTPDYKATDNKTGNKIWDGETDEMLGEGNVGLDLYDAEKKVAVAFISMREAQVLPETISISGFDARGLAELAAKDFAKQKGDVSVGVFYDPGNWGSDEHRRIYDEFEEQAMDTDQYRAALKALAEQDLRAQVRDFVAWLQNQGII